MGVCAHTGVGAELEGGEAHLGGALEAAEEELELPRRRQRGRQDDATARGFTGGGVGGWALLLLLVRLLRDGIGGFHGEGLAGFVRLLPLAGGRLRVRRHFWV